MNQLNQYMIKYKKSSSLFSYINLMYYIRYQMITYVRCKCIFIWLYLYTVCQLSTVLTSPGTPAGPLGPTSPCMNEKQSQWEVISSSCQHVNYLINNLMPLGNHLKCVKPAAAHGQKWSSVSILYCIMFISQTSLCKLTCRQKQN